MSSRSPRSQPPSGGKKSLPVVLGGIILAAIAGYFGLDLSDSNDSAPSTAVSTFSPVSDLALCDMETLPGEAADTRDDILAGGPYAYPENDNRRFGNYEGILPQQDRNYYREYTVDTPGLTHRGEKRIVTGGGTETDPQVWYYTDDHYESFCEIPNAE